MIRAQVNVTNRLRAEFAPLETACYRFADMHFGLALRPTDSTLPPGELARLAEQRGFDSLWFTGDGTARVLWNDSSVAGYDPFVALTFAAATTTHLRLGAVINLDQRDVIILAKEAASLDRLSGGRLDLGFYGRDEDRAHECIEALRALWRDEEPSFHGRYVSFDPVWSYPKPLQPDGPPLFVTVSLAAIALSGVGVLVPVGSPHAAGAAPRMLFLPLDASPPETGADRIVYVLPTGSAAEVETAAGHSK